MQFYLFCKDIATKPMGSNGMKIVFLSIYLKINKINYVAKRVLLSLIRYMNKENVKLYEFFL